jgi:hypothetical protein
VADAFTVEKHIGFGGDAGALQLFGHHVQAFFFRGVGRLADLPAADLRAAVVLALAVRLSTQMAFQPATK